jgi:hypothetical protein
MCQTRSQAVQCRCLRPAVKATRSRASASGSMRRSMPPTASVAKAEADSERAESRRSGRERPPNRRWPRRHPRSSPPHRPAPGPGHDHGAAAWSMPSPPTTPRSGPARRPDPTTTSPLHGPPRCRHPRSPSARDDADYASPRKCPPARDDYGVDNRSLPCPEGIFADACNHNRRPTEMCGLTATSAAPCDLTCVVRTRRSPEPRLRSRRRLRATGVARSSKAGPGSLAQLARH